MTTPMPERETVSHAEALDQYRQRLTEVNEELIILRCRLTARDREIAELRAQLD